ncbi:MAG: hypothetical protein JXA38_05115 [Methanosarcinaceae archaeon]|nr:hypothetical protein [Methanosarcinaceae archaeon]
MTMWSSYPSANEMLNRYPHIETEILQAVKTLLEKRYLTSLTNIRHELNVPDLTNRHIRTIAVKMEKDDTIRIESKSGRANKTLLFLK